MFQPSGVGEMQLNPTRVELPPPVPHRPVATPPSVPFVSLMVEDLPPPKADFSAPPPYEVAAKLPTYEEVQREKIRLGEPNNPEYLVSSIQGRGSN